MESAEKGKVSWMMKSAYGCGDASCNIVVGMISTVLTLFYTDYIGISPVVIGSVMLVSRILDGIATLIMGFLAQRTNTKYGKYRPWILWMSLPYTVSVVLLFTVPHTTAFLQGLYIFVAYNLCTTVFYTALNVPYGSLAYVMTRDTAERELLSIVRMCMASAGRLLTVSGTIPLVKLWGNDQSAWVKVTIIWAVLALLLLLFCFFSCRENVVIQVQNGQKNMLHSMKAVFRNGWFWMGASFQILQYVLFAVTGTILPYYCKYVFGDDTWLYSGLYFLETIILIAVMLTVPMMIKRFGKRNVSLLGIVLALTGQLLLFLGPESLALVTISCIIRGIGFAPLNSVLFAFLGEAVEYEYWKTNLRQESLMYAASTMFTKISAGLTAALITGLLSMSGYITVTGETKNLVQPQTAMDMIIGIYQFGPLIILLVLMIILFFYKLDKKLPVIMKDLALEERS